MQYHRSQRRGRKYIVGLVIIAVLVAVVFGWRYFIQSQAELGEVESENSSVTGKPDLESVSTRAVLFGEVSWSGAGQYKPEVVFKPLGRQQYDAWLGSLGCPIIPSGICSESEFNTFSGLFNGFALAEHGVEQIQPTRQILKNKSLQYFGQPDSSSDICSTLVLPARYRLTDGSHRRSFLPIAFCSINGDKVSSGDTSYLEVTRYAQLLPTWVYYSGSGMYDSTQRQKIFPYIDAGADGVIANFSDTPIAPEVHRGRLIMPGLGQVLSGPAYALNIELRSKLSDATSAWTSLAERCSNNGDQCFREAREQNLPKINYTYSYKSLAVNQGALAPEELSRLGASMDLSQLTGQLDSVTTD